MTLQNGFLSADEVRLYCDTAWLSAPDLKVCAFYPKAIHGLHWSWAATTTLVTPHPDEMLNFATAMGDAVAKGMGDLLADCQDWLHAFLERGGIVGRVLIGGFEPGSNEPDLWIVATDDLGFAAPFTPVSLASYVSSANDCAAYHDAMANGFTPERMRAVIDTQRNTPIEHPGWPGTYAIGGALVELIVRKDGVTANELHQWPDKVGEAINPAS